METVVVPLAKHWRYLSVLQEGLYFSKHLEISRLSLLVAENVSQPYEEMELCEK